MLPGISVRLQSQRGIVRVRIDRVSEGNFGDCGPVGEGVHELRIDYGPGYRVYFGESGGNVILLTGGTKTTQPRDIRTAQRLWADWKAANA